MSFQLRSTAMESTPFGFTHEVMGVRNVWERRLRTWGRNIFTELTPRQTPSSGGLNPTRIPREEFRKLITPVASARAVRYMATLITVNQNVAGSSPARGAMNKSP